MTDPNNRPLAAPGTTLEDRPPVRHQFSMIDLFIITMGAGIGLAGGNWMPVAAYVAVLAVVIMIAMLLVPLVVRWPEYLVRRCWMTLLAAYASSIAALALRS